MSDDELAQAAAQVRRRMRGTAVDVSVNIAEAMSVFAPLGWAMSAVWPYEGTVRALRAAEDGATTDRLDQMLTDIWNGEHARWMEIGVERLRRGGNAHWPFKADLWRRVDLVQKAIAHHQAGAYEASIPILFAQIEGLAFDVTDKAFFTKSQNFFAEAVDDKTLAGLGGNLEVVRSVCNANVEQRQSIGQFSRHGVMHGRELTYDTKVNSTKAIVLTISAFEHWLPQADKTAAALRAEHEREVAGRLGVDETGRLLDDRGVPELRNVRRELEGRYMRWINTGGIEPFDLRRDLGELATTHGAARRRFTIRGDNVAFWWSYRLPSGHILGWAARKIRPGAHPPHESWWWDAAAAPENAPWEDPTGWAQYPGDAEGAWRPDDPLF